MAKQLPAKPKARGRPYKGKLKATLRLSQAVVDALDHARASTGRDKSDIAEEAISAYLHLRKKQKG
ncbi:MAG: ribbon-helix-helix protein, CopG family [Verrucomicrobia bacterium]|nr:ribbon-helix-helix protein, CopG family [Verrucomicrobiota bacterium]